MRNLILILILAFLLIAIYVAFEDSANEPKEKFVPYTHNENLKQAVFFDVKTLIKKSPKEVAVILGQPSKANPKEGEYEYKNGSIIINYKDNVPQYVEFTDLKKYRYENLPEIFGFRDRRPSEVDKDYTWYKSLHENIKLISFLPSKDSVGMLESAIVEYW